MFFRAILLEKRGTIYRRQAKQVVIAAFLRKAVSRCNRPYAGAESGFLLFKSIRLFHSSFLAVFFA
jgi:hypothetical protein